MPLPEKRYIPLDDLVKRWGTDLGNLRYYAEHKLLEIQVWLERKALKVFEPRETTDGKIVWQKVGLKEYKGYLVLDPDEIRKVFRHGKCSIRRFASLDGKQSYRILDNRARCKVTVTDMVVTKSESERFETACDLDLAMPDAYEGSKSTIIKPTSFSGRPSVMYKVEQQMRRRAATGKLEPSLKRESEHLHSWASQTIEDHQVPRPGSIANALRHVYTQMKVHEIA